MQSAQATEDSRKKRLEEAFETLSAASKEAKNDVVDLLKGKYKSFRKQLTEFVDEFEDNPTFEQMKTQSQRLLRQSERWARTKADQVDSSVHDHPWGYILGSAAVGLVIGLMLGRR